MMWPAIIIIGSLLVCWFVDNLNHRRTIAVLKSELKDCRDACSELEAESSSFEQKLSTTRREFADYKSRVQAAAKGVTWEEN